MTHSINVAFSTTNGLFSRVIRWFTKSKVSHSLITFRDETLDKVFVMEANGRGFMLVPWSKWKKHNTLLVRFSFDLPEEDQLESLRALSESLGAEYDYISLVGFIFMRFKKRMSNPFNDTTKLICSEAVVRFLNKLDSSFKDPSTWTPEDLLTKIQKERSGIFVLENFIDS